MTVMPSPGGKSRGPVEGEGPERAVRPAHIDASVEEGEGIFFNKVKEWLNGEVNEAALWRVIKEQSKMSWQKNPDSVMNDIISSYLDLMQHEADRSSGEKIVRFNELLEVPSTISGSQRPSSIDTKRTTVDKSTEVPDVTTSDSRAGPKTWSQSSMAREEQELIKAIEESLKDNPNAPIAQKDPKNPFDRCRVGLTPVGLKNTGNSCWFNVLAQALFHIPRFRLLLLKLLPPCLPGNGCTPTTLVHDIRKLFGFLLASERSYVDPSDCLTTISSLNESLNKTVPSLGIQQDATEMFLRLIEWLEKALTNLGSYSPVNHELPSDIHMDWSSSEIPSSSGCLVSTGVCCSEKSTASEMPPQPSEETAEPMECNTSSYENNNLIDPFKSLFYGSHIEIRRNEDNEIPEESHLDDSLQMLNLDVKYDNLHDSLEAFHFSDAPKKELWFKSLPPVIMFSLVRFSYKNGKTEKVHSKFNFPVEFYMDRYLYKHHKVVQVKRSERLLLKKELSIVKGKLDRYERVPIGTSGHESLPNIINALLSFPSCSLTSYHGRSSESMNVFVPDVQTPMINSETSTMNPTRKGSQSYTFFFSF
ncbi:hypothetical protein AB6A40_002919 [Gnathostoma spinigerum]|uniref:USP domain-containing protein n=1 Tax=Gnathostoma spinigerum TaxID=75299 RepID=A0ABD6E966_9BILA